LQFHYHLYHTNPLITNILTTFSAGTTYSLNNPINLVDRDGDHPAAILLLGLLEAGEYSADAACFYFSVTDWRENPSWNTFLYMSLDAFALAAPVAPNIGKYPRMAKRAYNMSRSINNTNNLRRRLTKILPPPKFLARIIHKL
jgi:hypothetical protein